MDKYCIPEGLHISHIFPSFHKNVNSLDFNFCFSNNCIYDLKDDDNRDVNKLYGLGFGINHHNNSIRIGWNCEKKNGNIQLHAYYYNNSKRNIAYICEVKTKVICHCVLSFDRVLNKFFIYVKDDEKTINAEFKFDFKECKKWGFKLYPYFGGNKTAPHKMSLYLKDIK
ncbi:MAG: hypothetical protein IT243_06115 [Bacteroidia bacterium]|nr:hypothetical protein [Bacteroidia bacterium]